MTVQDAYELIGLLLTAAFSWGMALGIWTAVVVWPSRRLELGLGWAIAALGVAIFLVG
mgnify:CR=1 FL=1|tara:strand:- start:39793 stop:39966 length:174 start_codon:yes stop_codon:yes gene_type:complete